MSDLTPEHRDVLKADYRAVGDHLLTTVNLRFLSFRVSIAFSSIFVPAFVYIASNPASFSRPILIFLPVVAAAGNLVFLLLEERARISHATCFERGVEIEGGKSCEENWGKQSSQVEPDRTRARPLMPRVRPARPSRSRSHQSGLSYRRTPARE